MKCGMDPEVPGKLEPHRYRIDHLRYGKRANELKQDIPGWPTKPSVPDGNEGQDYGGSWPEADTKRP